VVNEYNPRYDSVGIKDEEKINRIDAMTESIVGRLLK